MKALAVLAVLTFTGCATMRHRAEMEGSGGGFTALPPLQLEVFGQGVTTGVITGDSLAITGNSVLGTVTVGGQMGAAGATFSGDVAVNGWVQPTTAVFMSIRGKMANGASAIGTVLDTSISLTTAGGKLVQVLTAGVEKSHIDIDGSYRFAGNPTLQTCAAGIEGKVSRDVLSGLATAKRTKLCLCTSNGSSVYVWQNLATATLGTATTCGTE